jgi:hypothetical protein
MRVEHTIVLDVDDEAALRAHAAAQLAADGAPPPETLADAIQEALVNVRPLSPLGAAPGPLDVGVEIISWRTKEIR